MRSHNRERSGMGNAQAFIRLLQITVFSVLLMPNDAQEGAWPMRFHVEYQGMDALRGQQQDLIQHTYIPRILASFSREVKIKATQPPNSVFGLTTPCMSALPGTSFCEEYADIPQMCGSAIHNPSLFLSEDVCELKGGRRTCKPMQRGDGVYDVDFILYVVVNDDPMCTAARFTGFGGPCEMTAHRETGRPLAGFINLCPFGMVLDQNEPQASQFLDSGMLMLMQALAFHRSLFPRYVDELMVPRNMENMFDVTGDGREFLKTPRVLEEARAHYSCRDMRGMPLENSQLSDVTSVQSSNLTNGLAYFESHLAFGDILVADIQFSAGAGISESGLARGAWDRGALTRISMAVLEDTGWYLPDWHHAMPLTYGRNAGCEFVLAGKCTDGLLPIRSSSISYNCQNSFDNEPSCTTDLRSYGVCRAPRDFWDGCAVPRFYYPRELGYAHQCEDSRYGTDDGKTWGTVAGINSRCFGARDLRREIFTSLNLISPESTMLDKPKWSDLDCYKMECRQAADGASQEVWVVLSLETPVSFRCPAGELIDVATNEVTKKAGFLSGTFGPCPSPDIVCEGLQCPSGCGPFGTCMGGVCKCHIGYTGTQCQERMCSIDGANEPCSSSRTCDLQTGTCSPKPFAAPPGPSYPPLPTQESPPSPPLPTTPSPTTAPTPMPTPKPTLPPTTTVPTPAPTSGAPALATPQPTPAQTVPAAPILAAGDMVVELAVRLTGEGASRISEDMLDLYRAGISKVTGLGISRLVAGVKYAAYGQIDSSRGSWTIAEGFALKRAVGFTVNRPTSLVNVTLQALEGCTANAIPGKPWASTENSGSSIVAFEITDADYVKANRFLEAIEESSSDGTLRERLIFDLNSLLSQLTYAEVPHPIMAVPPAIDALVTVRVQLLTQGEASVALQTVRNMQDGVTGVLKDVLGAEQGQSVTIIGDPHLKQLSEEDFVNEAESKGDANVYYLPSPCSPAESSGQDKETDNSDIFQLPAWTWAFVVSAIILTALALILLYYVWRRKNSQASAEPPVSPNANKKVNLMSLEIVNDDDGQQLIEASGWPRSPTEQQRPGSSHGSATSPNQQAETPSPRITPPVPAATEQIPGALNEPAAKEEAPQNTWHQQQPRSRPSSVPSFANKLKLEVDEFPPVGPYPPSGNSSPKPWTPPADGTSPRVFPNPSAPTVGLPEAPYRDERKIASDRSGRLDRRGNTVNSIGQAYISNSKRPTSPMFFMNGGPPGSSRLRSELLEKFAVPGSTGIPKLQGAPGASSGFPWNLPSDGPLMAVSPRSLGAAIAQRPRAASASVPRSLQRRPATSPAILDDGALRGKLRIQGWGQDPGL